eukprot:CAMPEP_0113680352 /NCGR_PEP_ID=MMETSP0038_2-20120614/11261_1 /TAXON_ID=2898 /ORGANISM="Cryptomonas paramecium" /LENGTH=75 /DNA_ID=CAMNT_0000598703 /DNA_START=46 /DNA_END=270 /DNA_ORIENTATION=- /assembly_acc=CAM_ASM_000170
MMDLGTNSSKRARENILKATHEADHFSSSSEEESLAEDAEEADENDDRISIIGREWGSNLTLDAFDCRPAANIYS